MQRELCLKLMELIPVPQPELAAGWIWEHRDTAPQHLGAPGWVLSFLSSFWGQEWEMSYLCFIPGKLRGILSEVKVWGCDNMVTSACMPTRDWPHQELRLCFCHPTSQTLSLFLPRHSYYFILSYETVSTTHKLMRLTWDSAALMGH